MADLKFLSWLRPSSIVFWYFVALAVANYRLHPIRERDLAVSAGLQPRDPFHPHTLKLQRREEFVWGGRPDGSAFRFSYLC
jgi:hypothetical protein